MVYENWATPFLDTFIVAVFGATIWFPPLMVSVAELAFPTTEISVKQLGVVMYFVIFLQGTPL